MPFFVYGRDAKSLEVARRRISHAATAAEARIEVERFGIVVTAVLPCPELRVPQPLVSRSRTDANPASEMREAGATDTEKVTSDSKKSHQGDATERSADKQGAEGRAAGHDVAPVSDVGPAPKGSARTARGLRIAGIALLVIAVLTAAAALGQHAYETPIVAAIVAIAGMIFLVVARRTNRSGGGTTPIQPSRFVARAISIAAIAVAFGYLCSVSLPRIAWNAVNLQAMSFARQGEHARAEQWETVALWLAERASGPVSIPVAVCANNLGKIYLDSSQYDLAEPLFKRALGIREKLLPGGHTDIAQSLHNLAALYVNEQRFAQARPLLERALEMQEKALGEDSLEVAMSLNGLGLIDMSNGNFIMAEQSQRRALAIREKHGGSQTEVAESLANLAAVYLTQNRYDDAAPPFERALKIWEQTLPADHPNLALCLDGLGTVYVGQGKYDQAEPLLRRALSIRERVYGPRHPAVAETVESLALLYRKQGLYASAEPLYERMIAIEEKVQKPDSPALAAILDGVAQFYREAGKPDRAQALSARAAAVRGGSAR